MGNRLTKIYTRTGDDGTTGMADGSRVNKSELTFEVMGDVDELNAHIGMIAAQINAQLKSLTSESASLESASLESWEDTNLNITNILGNKGCLLNTISVVQHLLFNVGGELSMPEYKGINDDHIVWLESEIDRLNANLQPLKDFILPAGSVLVSQTHIARTVCRRAERKAVALISLDQSALSSQALRLLNRLSDWLFVLSRYCAKIEGSKEVLWNKSILEQFS